MAGGVPQALGRLTPVASARRRAALALRSRVAGERAADRARLIWDTPGERWFTRADPIWWVHADASMFPGGIRALLLQSLHPLAMTAVAEHSGYRDDPWARVQNTSAFLAATTFGTVRVAEQAVDAVRRVHATVRGVTADGRAYSADDPHLLRWVHLAEVESFLTCYQHFGSRRLSPRHADRYVEQTGRVAALLGVVDPPATEAELRQDLDRYRPELDATQPALDVARYLLLSPPLSRAARPGYAALASGAMATLPGWARRMLAVPRFGGVSAVVGRPAGRAATATVRWVMGDPSATSG
jgi:uncharacterized protein (DUF2236 family)